MHRALLELTIEGVETSRDFHLRLMEDAEFRRGYIEIQWLERRLPSLTAVAAPDDTARAATIAAALFADRDRQRGRSTRGAEGIATVPSQTAWQRTAREEGLR
jgi:acetyl-CoA carboxylase, biotin carboxylase subunit